MRCAGALQLGQQQPEPSATSNGSVADSYDNAVAEALKGTFKAELIDPRIWSDHALRSTNTPKTA